MLIHLINLEDQEIEYLIFLIPVGVFHHLVEPSKIKEKLESIAHTEFNNEKFKNSKHIINCQKTGEDLFHRKIHSKRIDKTFFPKDLLILMEENSRILSLDLAFRE